MIRESVPSKIFDVVNCVLVGLIAILSLYPIWHVVMGSFSDPEKLFLHMGLMLKPDGISLTGYKVVFQTKSIWTGYRNTFILVGAGTVVRMFITSLGAYVLSRKTFMFRRAIMLMILVTMYFSGGLIPSFLLVNSLGMYDSFLALIIPSAINTWNMLVLRSAFESVPASLTEAARIDGANDVTILFRILFPVAKATLAVITLYYVVAEWNSWFSATIYLQDRGKFPLQVILREVLISKSSTSTGAGDAADATNIYLEELVRYCTIVVSTLPILVAYPMVQKYFVRGVMMGSLKE